MVTYSWTVNTCSCKYKPQHWTYKLQKWRIFHERSFYLKCIRKFEAKRSKSLFFALEDNQEEHRGLKKTSKQGLCKHDELKFQKKVYNYSNQKCLNFCKTQNNKSSLYKCSLGWSKQGHWHLQVDLCSVVFSVLSKKASSPQFRWHLHLSLVAIFNTPGNVLPDLVQLSYCIE